MSSHWPPTFNVIYVPGTVHTLVGFAGSLADHSPYRFRLVSNGCTAEEEAVLAERASMHPGLEFSSLESKAILPHGEALQRLFGSESADYFACIDSDIFARGPFLTEAQSLLHQHAALFSGLPTWLPPEERVMPADFVFMGGRFTQTDDGRCLGVSYCVVYRRASLELIMSRAGTTFHSRRWWDLSPEQRVLLSRMKVEKRRYDTTKLVNLMLGQSGFSLLMCPEPHLVHLGGLSNLSVRPLRPLGRIFARVREMVEANWPGPIPRRRAPERAMTRSVFRRRRMVEAYFQHVLAGGPVDGGPAQRFPVSGRQQLVEIGRELLALRRHAALPRDVSPAAGQERLAGRAPQKRAENRHP